MRAGGSGGCECTTRTVAHAGRSHQLHHARRMRFSPKSLRLWKHASPGYGQTRRTDSPIVDKYEALSFCGFTPTRPRDVSKLYESIKIVRENKRSVSSRRVGGAVQCRDITGILPVVVLPFRVRWAGAEIVAQSGARSQVCLRYEALRRRNEDEIVRGRCAQIELRGRGE